MHATYLLAGVRRVTEPPAAVNGKARGDGEDEVMQSSPFVSSAPEAEPVEEPVPVRSLVLAREEELDGRVCVAGLQTADETAVKGDFETLTSVHVYSIEPHGLKVRRMQLTRPR